MLEATPNSASSGWCGRCSGPSLIPPALLYSCVHRRPGSSEGEELGRKASCAEPIRPVDPGAIGSNVQKRWQSGTSEPTHCLTAASRVSSGTEEMYYKYRIHSHLASRPPREEGRQGKPFDPRAEGGLLASACTGTETEQLRPTMLCSYCTIPTSADIRKRALRTCSEPSRDHLEEDWRSLVLNGTQLKGSLQAFDDVRGRSWRSVV